MRTALCDVFGIKYPIFAFSPVARVAAAVSKAGGLGVLGAIGSTPAGLEDSLKWMDEELQGIPYGVDVVMPAKSAEGVTQDAANPERMRQSIRELIPEANRAWVRELMDRFNLPPIEQAVAPVRQGAQGAGGGMGGGLLGWTEAVARAHVEVAFAHPIKLIANALGPPPGDVIDEAHKMGLKVAALAGKPVHGDRHVRAGVDIVISQSYEAGGHTGDIGGMVLLPEMVAAVAPTPVLAAGAMATGRQIAAALALGAQGAWCGSVWLPTEEGSGMMGNANRYLKATSSDTVRTKWFTGKSARALRNEWTDAWEGKDSPGTLPMPLQNVLVSEAIARMGAAGRGDLMFTPVGQVVGMLNEVKPVAKVVEEMVAEYDEVVTRMQETVAKVRARS
jgi:NAD(P)H-dependent flavin oxidoreductase YrpB (nitropropane dioxygenase family)